MADVFALAIDLGTSGPKAAVVSARGEIRSTGHAHVETLFLPGAGAEQDPEAVWNAVKVASAQAVSASGVSPADIRAVICTSQYSSIVPVGADGRPTMNMITWHDQRGAAGRLRKLDSCTGPLDRPHQLLVWLRKHGLPPIGTGNDSLSHMRWIKFARPEVYDRTETFLEPMDYVALRFTGRRAANQCTAFMLLMTSNRSLNVTRYDPQLVRYSGIDEAKLPELLPLDAIVGTVLPDVAAELGLSPQTKMVTGLNDTQAGGLATGAFQGNHAGISVGSTSVMITHVPFKRTDVLHAILSMPSPVPDTYFVMAENGTSGAALSHFLNEFIFADDAFGHLANTNGFSSLATAVGRVPPGSDGVLFLPWMSGSIAPAADAHVRGGFLNLGLETTRPHMARAVLEGVAMNLRWLRKPVERFAKREFTHTVFYGGGAESDQWAQIMADVLRLPVHQMEQPRYATCVGAALLAFERLGVLAFSDFQPLVRIRRVYEPRAEYRAMYDSLFEQFVSAFKRNRGVFRGLNAKRASP